MHEVRQPMLLTYVTLLGGLICCLLASVPGIWHQSSELWWQRSLRFAVWGVGAFLFISGILPILGIL
jgi:hypothetical protein